MSKDNEGKIVYVPSRESLDRLAQVEEQLKLLSKIKSKAEIEAEEKAVTAAIEGLLAKDEADKAEFEALLIEEAKAKKLEEDKQAKSAVLAEAENLGDMAQLAAQDVPVVETTVPTAIEAPKPTVKKVAKPKPKAKATPKTTIVKVGTTGTNFGKLLGNAGIFAKNFPVASPEQIEKAKPTVVNPPKAEPEAPKASRTIEEDVDAIFGALGK